MSAGMRAPGATCARRRELLAWIAAGLTLGSSGAKADPQVDFFRAVELDRPEAVRALLDAGVDVNAVSAQGQSGLMLALREQSLQVVALLLGWPKLAFDSPNAAGETPLMMACLKGNREVVKQLILLGAEVQRPGWTPLHYAASGGHVDLMQRLLAAGAALDGRAPGGRTPLMMAAGFGGIDAADWLVSQGANAGLRNDAGRSAADFARSAGWDALAERLERAANDAARDKH